MLVPIQRKGIIAKRPRLQSHLNLSIHLELLIVTMFLYLIPAIQAQLEIQEFFDTCFMNGDSWPYTSKPKP